MRTIYVKPASVNKDGCFTLGNRMAILEISGEKQSYSFKMTQEEILQLKEQVDFLAGALTEKGTK